MPKPCLTDFANQRKELLERSLLSLMNRKPYQDISVKDICAEADIPRRTFYHYFDSKEDVLESIIEDLMRRCFLDVMLDYHLGTETMRNSFARVFSFWVGENRVILDALIRNELESRLITWASGWARKERIGSLKNSNLDPKLVEIGLMVGTTDFFTLLFYWSREGYHETPEQMAEYAIWVLPKVFYNL